MNQITIDLTGIETREQLHRTLSEQLDLPIWYGKNLDALYDCLTSVFVDQHLTLIAPEALEDALGSYGQCFFHVLEAVQQENTHFSFSLQPVSAEGAEESPL